MVRRGLLCITVWCALPGTANSQAWLDSYRAGDYAAAARLIHPIVADVADYERSGDPRPAQHLAVMYAEGLGVTRDPVMACGFASQGVMAARMAPPQYVGAENLSLRRIGEAEAFASKQCQALSPEEQQVGLRAIACSLGMPEQELTLGPHTVRVGRDGIRGPTGPPVPADYPCGGVIAALRAVTVTPPVDAAPGVSSRYFIHIFAWVPRGVSGQRNGYALQWFVHEVHEGGVGLAMGPQPLAESDSWPEPGLPDDIAKRVSLEMIRSGHVRWKIDGAPPRRGWIMLKGESAR